MNKIEEKWGKFKESFEEWWGDMSPTQRVGFCLSLPFILLMVGVALGGVIMLIKHLPVVTLIITIVIAGFVGIHLWTEG